MSPWQIKQQIASLARKAYDKGFMAAYDGNFSFRLDENKFLITRSGVCKGEINPSDVLTINESGEVVEGLGKPSTEFKIHINAYKKRKDVNAVVHCHPVYASAFAAAGKPLDKNVFPEIILTLGKIPLCNYATPSTDALPESMNPYIGHAWAFLLQNHGAVTFGIDINDAYFKMEKLEHYAKIIFISRQLGGEKEISMEKVKELLAISKEAYGFTQDERNI